MLIRNLILSRLVLLAVVLTTTPVGAQVVLNDMRPFALKRGVTTDVRFLGDRLADTYKMLSYTPELIAHDFEVSDDNKSVRAKIEVPPDFPLGWHAIRLASPRGLSTLRTFYIGDSATRMEPQEPHGKDAALDISFPALITGRLLPRELDAYSFQAEEGTPISIEVQAMRAGRAQVDARLALYAPDGKQIAACDDTALTKEDPFISIIAPQTGTYRLDIDEARYVGSGRSWYLLHVGSFPRPVRAEPISVEEGKQVAFDWGAGDQMIVATAERSFDGKRRLTIYPANAHGIAPTPVFVRISHFAAVAEIEPNQQAEVATEIPFPTAVHGEIAAADDRDWYRFSGKKGQVVIARIFARKPIRSALDSIVSIRAANGRVLGSNDDAGGPDSRLQVTLPEDGEYTVLVQGLMAQPDLQKKLVYCLEVGPPQPDFSITVPDRRRNVSATIGVPQGNRSAAMLIARRQNALGPVSFEQHNLPTGASCELADIVQGRDRQPFVIEATADTALDATLLNITGTLQSGKVARNAPLRLRQRLTSGRNNVELCAVPLNRLAVAVTKPAPVRVEIVPPQVEIVQTGSMQLKIQANRDEGFTGQITLNMLYNPPGLSSQGNVRIAGDKNEVVITLTANKNAAIGTWPIAIRANSTDNREPSSLGSFEISTQVIPLQIGKPYFNVELPHASIEQGNSAAYVVKLVHEQAFPGTAKAELLGLPSGLTSAPIEFTADTESLTFELTAEANARPGRHNLRCRLTIQKQGEPIVHILGSGKLRVDKPLPAKKT